MQMQSNEINELAAALSKAQSIMGYATKENNNPFFKSKYADLAAVWGACREALCENNLSVIQTLDVTSDTHAQFLVTTLCHSSGQWIKSIIMLPIQKAGPQEIGSCITYCRRYALASMVGVYQDDDDGETAQKPFRKEFKQIQKSESNPISEEQAENIYGLLELNQDKESVKSFYSYMKEQLKAPSIYEIDQRDYNKIIKALEARVNKENANHGTQRMA